MGGHILRIRCLCLFSWCQVLSCAVAFRCRLRLLEMYLDCVAFCNGATQASTRPNGRVLRLHLLLLLCLSLHGEGGPPPDTREGSGRVSWWGGRRYRAHFAGTRLSCWTLDLRLLLDSVLGALSRMGFSQPHEQGAGPRL